MCMCMFVRVSHQNLNLEPVTLDTHAVTSNLNTNTYIYIIL